MGLAEKDKCHHLAESHADGGYGCGKEGTGSLSQASGLIPGAIHKPFSNHKFVHITHVSGNPSELEKMSLIVILKSKAKEKRLRGKSLLRVTGEQAINSINSTWEDKILGKLSVCDAHTNIKGLGFLIDVKI